MREGCFQVIETGGLHVAGLINQAFYTVIRNHFLYLQLSGEPDSSILLADIYEIEPSAQHRRNQRRNPFAEILPERGRYLLSAFR